MNFDPHEKNDSTVYSVRLKTADLEFCTIIEAEYQVPIYVALTELPLVVGKTRQARQEDTDIFQT